MSTPLKALIQERLRAKMVGRRMDDDLDDDYECNSDRLQRQPMDVTAYDITSRGAEDDSIISTSSRGSTSRRSSSTQSSHPLRLHPYIDPSPYLVPLQHDDPYYPSTTSYGSSRIGQGDHCRLRYSRYSREQYRDTNAYDLPLRPEQQRHLRDQCRRHHNQHRVRDQLSRRYETLYRGESTSRQKSQNRAFVSAWHHSDASTPTKSNSMATSPTRAVSSPVHSPSPRAHRKQNYGYLDHFEHDNYTHPRRDAKNILSSPGAIASSSSSHQKHHQHHYQRQRHTWKDRAQDYINQAAYEAREPSPTRRHVHHQAFDKPAWRSSVHYKLSNKTESSSCCITTIPSPRKPQPEEVILPDITNILEQPEQHCPPQLNMEVIEPPTETSCRIRAWDDIMSPQSRLAAKAFVEKRQRRTGRSTPRTLATQRWLDESAVSSCGLPHKMKSIVGV